MEDGWNVLVGADKEKIANMANDFEPTNKRRDVFGGGDASGNIREIIELMVLTFNRDEKLIIY